MKTCDVVTIHHGTVQAIKGPIAYFGYMPEFNNYSFAIDAKMFVATLRKFRNGFNVVQKDNLIVFFDDKQETDFVPQPAEILLSTKNINWINNSDFPIAWNIAQKFVTLDFPGFRVGNDYIEVLSDQSIARIQTPTIGIKGIYAAVKLPAGISRIAEHNNKLWFAASPSDYIIVNSLDIEFPRTDIYFDAWGDYEMVTIPDILKDRFVLTEQTVFDTDGVKFVQKEKATAAIENVAGHGTYDGKLFSNLVTHAQRYSFQTRFLAFESGKIQGVIARA